MVLSMTIVVDTCPSRCQNDKSAESIYGAVRSYLALPAPRGEEVSARALSYFILVVRAVFGIFAHDVADSMCKIRIDDLPA